MMILVCHCLLLDPFPEFPFPQAEGRPLNFFFVPILVVSLYLLYSMHLIVMNLEKYLFFSTRLLLSHNMAFALSFQNISRICKYINLYRISIIFNHILISDCKIGVAREYEVTTSTLFQRCDSPVTCPSFTSPHHPTPSVKTLLQSEWNTNKRVSDHGEHSLSWNLSTQKECAISFSLDSALWDKPSP